MWPHDQIIKVDRVSVDWLFVYVLVIVLLIPSFLLFSFLLTYYLYHHPYYTAILPLTYHQQIWLIAVQWTRSFQSSDYPSHVSLYYCSLRGSTFSIRQTPESTWSPHPIHLNWSTAWRSWNQLLNGVLVLRKGSNPLGGYPSKSSSLSLYRCNLTISGHAQTIYSAMADFSRDDPITYERYVLSVVKREIRIWQVRQLLRLTDGGTM